MNLYVSRLLYLIGGVKRTWLFLYLYLKIFIKKKEQKERALDYLNSFVALIPNL